jgi:hypothetical protein
MKKENLAGVQLFDFSENRPKLNTSETNSSKKINDISLLSNNIENVTANQSNRFHCNICDIFLNAKVVFDQHLVGQKHLKRVTQGNQPVESIAEANSDKLCFKCEICNILNLSKYSHAQHVLGQRHLKKLAELNKGNPEITVEKMVTESDIIIDKNPTGKKNKKIRRKPKINSNEANGNDMSKASGDKVIEMVRCEVCDLNLVTKDQLTIHLSGKKHLKKLNSVTSGEASSSSKKQTDEEKFQHLNIAWDKYKVVNQLISDSEVSTATGEKYEFYCSLCKKYMQRKMQLVDHLKSKKHHRKIYEKRVGVSQANNGNPVDQLSKKQIKKGLMNRPKSFVPSSNPPTLSALRFGNKFNKPQNQNNSYNSTNQASYSNFNNTPIMPNSSSYQSQQVSMPNQMSNFQPGQASFKTAPVVYNQYNSIKRKSPGIDNSYPNYMENNNMDTIKYRKNNDSIAVSNSNQEQYYNQSMYNTVQTDNTNWQMSSQPHFQSANLTNPNLKPISNPNNASASNNVAGSSINQTGSNPNDPYQGYSYNMFSNTQYPYGMQYPASAYQNPADNNQQNNMNR